jgi:hypothetical protein
VTTLFKSWTYEDDRYESGADLRDATITWWGQPKGPAGHFGGGACDQRVDDFVRSGPAVPDVPERIAREILAALGEPGAPWLSKLRR